MGIKNLCNLISGGGQPPKSKKGKVVTPEHRTKISAANKGRILSAEHRSKISAASKRQKPSKEHVDKLVARWTGRKHTEAARLKMSVSKKSYASPQGTSRRNNTGGYFGVYWWSVRNKWRSSIYKNGKTYSSSHANKESAARAYNAKALELYGPTARLNVILSDLLPIFSYADKSTHPAWCSTPAPTT